MDALIRVRAAADGLLAQVDGALTRHGAPGEHEIWGLLKRSGLLPGDALAGAADWLPPVLAGRAALLRRQAEAHADVWASLSGSAALSGWEGEAATAFEVRMGTIGARLDEAGHAAERLAGCLDELADWLGGARHRLARTLADALVSAEAVTLAVPGPLASPVAQANAAATIGASVLAEVGTFWDTGLEIWQRHATTTPSTSKPLVQGNSSAAMELRVQ